MHLTLPITDPVLIVAVAMGVFLVVPLVFERLRLPGLIGLIVAGALLGPHGTGVLARDATIVLLGTVGLLYLMFLVGLELNLPEFSRYRNRSLVFGSLSFVVPQAMGTAVGVGFGYPLASSLLLGAVFASHTVLAYPIASRLGIVKNPAVTTTLGGTILTEVLALLVLAVIAGSAGAGIGPGFWSRLLGALAVYVLLVLWGVPRLGQWFFRNVRAGAATEFSFVMAVLFTVAYLAHAAHVEPIIGALLAGLAMNRLVPEQGALISRIHFAGNALFIPFFLLSVGMLVDAEALADSDAWLFSAVLALGILFSKWLAARLTQRVSGYTRDEGWTIFGLSVPHASGTLAIVLVGFDLGFFDQTEVNAVVLTILLTSLIGPWAVERWGRRVALREEQRPYEPLQAPQRILIPVSNPATEEVLLDLALAIRGSEEPLYPLMVVRGDGAGAEAQVAEAEKLLGHAVIYAASADVPVVPLTRLDVNIATGIARGAAETRAAVIVLGWSPERSTAEEFFGNVLDQLLEGTRQMVLVAKLGHALNTTRRLVLVLAGPIHRHPGFPEVARLLKTMAARLGATLVGWVVEGDPQRFQALRHARPEVPLELHGLAEWADLLPALQRELRADDLVVEVNARRGSVAWQPRLGRLPEHLVELAPESVLVIYPPEPQPADGPEGEGPALPRGLAPERIVTELPALPYDEALQRILEVCLADELNRMGPVAETLDAGVRTYSVEIRPGVVVPHARVAGLERVLLFLGVSPEGVVFPHATEAAHLIFVLLSPEERPREHLMALAEIAHWVNHPERLAELLAHHAPDTTLDWISLPDA